MRLRSQTQNNFASRPARFSVLGIDKGAIGDASGKVGPIRLAEAQSAAHLRAQTVCADQEISLVARCREATLQTN